MKIEQHLNQLQEIKPRPALKDKVDVWTDQLDSGTSIGWMSYLLRPAILGLGLLFLLGTGTAWATYQSQPGDVLFPVKKSIADFVALGEKEALEGEEEIEELQSESTASASPKSSPKNSSLSNPALDSVENVTETGEEAEDTSEEVLDTVDEIIDTTTDTVDQVLGVQSPQENDQNNTNSSQNQDSSVIEVDTNLQESEGGDESNVKLRLSL